MTHFGPKMGHFAGLVRIRVLPRIMCINGSKSGPRVGKMGVLRGTPLN